MKLSADAYNDGQSINAWKDRSCKSYASSRQNQRLGIKGGAKPKRGNKWGNKMIVGSDDPLFHKSSKPSIDPSTW